MVGASGTYVSGGVRVSMDPAPVVYTKLFYPTSGPDRHLRKEAVKVATLAKELAPKVSGRLANSITVDQNRTKKGEFSFGFKVYTPIYYGLYVHEGTAPHVMNTYPDRMKFLGTNGHPMKKPFRKMPKSYPFVVTPIVHHPGNSANPFLQEALFAMGY